MADWKEIAKLLTQIGVSIFILALCSVLVFGNFPDDFKKWAFGLIPRLPIGFFIET